MRQLHVGQCARRRQSGAHGHPAVVVVGEQFVGAARSVARTAGLADISFVVLAQNDYLVEDDDRIHDKVEPLVDRILERLFVAPGQG